MSNVHHLMTGAELHDNKPPNVVQIDDADHPYTMLGTEDVLIVTSTSARVDVTLPTAASREAPILIVCLDGGGGGVRVNADSGIPDQIGGAGGGAALTDLGATDDYAYLWSDGVSRWVGIKGNSAW